MARMVWLLGLLLPAGCAGYVPPGPAPMAAAAEVAAPFDVAWAAASRVAQGSAFTVTAAEKSRGALTLALTTVDPEQYVDCGETGTTPELGEFDAMGLQATADVSLRPMGTARTAIGLAARYTLAAYRIDPFGTRWKITEWRFDGAGSDTRRVGLRLVTCRSSQWLERALPAAVAGRI